jgi:hypothetical protein
LSQLFNKIHKMMLKKFRLRSNFWGFLWKWIENLWFPATKTDQTQFPEGEFGLGVNWLGLTNYRSGPKGPSLEGPLRGPESWLVVEHVFGCGRFWPTLCGFATQNQRKWTKLRKIAPAPKFERSVCWRIFW